MRAPRLSWRALSIAAVALSIQLAGCLEAAREQGRDPAVATIAAERAGLGEPAVRGKALYAQYCAVCHGETGAGDGFNAYSLKPPPPDLRAVVATGNDALIASVMRDGSGSIGKSPLCPPYGRSLDDEARGFILEFLREGLKPSGSQPLATH